MASPARGAAAGRAILSAGGGSSLGGVLGDWRPEPAALVAILLLALLYKAGRRRSPGAARRGHRTAAGRAGILLLFAATATPLEALADALFSWHMLQHVLIALAAAPLLVLGRVPAVMAAAVPGGRRAMRWLHGLERAPATPVVLWCAFTGTVWAWHVPFAYDAALRHPALHAFEHATLLASGLLFWDVCLVRAPGRGFGTGIAMLFTAMLQMAALSSALIFSPEPWYAPYASGLAGWPLTSAADQQLAGVVMWTAGSAVTFCALAWLMATWFRTEERRASRPSALPAVRPVQER